MLEDPVERKLRRKSERKERQRNATRNLLIFSGLILTLPIGCFFLLNRLMGAVGGGVGAVVMANVVLISYVLLAMSEEEEEDRHRLNPEIIFQDRDPMAEEFIYKEKIQ